MSATDSAAVDLFFNAVTDVLVERFGAELHIGYWDDTPCIAKLGAATDRMTDRLIELLDVTTGDRVLDLGCGTGRTALRLAARTGADVLGVSPSRHQIERATVRADHAGLAHRIRFIQGDGRDLPLPGGTFDAVLASESLGHMELGRPCVEIARVLREGGRFVLSDGVLADSTDERTRERIAWLSGVFDRVCPPTLTQLRDLLGRIGFSVVELTDITERTTGSPTLLAELLDTAECAKQVRGHLDRLIHAMREGDAIPEIRFMTVVAQRKGPQQFSD